MKDNAKNTNPRKTSRNSSQAFFASVLTPRGRKLFILDTFFIFGFILISILITPPVMDVASDVDAKLSSIDTRAWIVALGAIATLFGIYWTQRSNANLKREEFENEQKKHLQKKLEEYSNHCLKHDAELVDLTRQVLKVSDPKKRPDVKGLGEEVPFLHVERATLIANLYFDDLVDVTKELYTTSRKVFEIAARSSEKGTNNSPTYIWESEEHEQYRATKKAAREITAVIARNL